MYKVICSYDKEKVVKKNKATLKKSLVVSVVLAFLLVAVGVWNIVFALAENKINWLSLVIGVFACLFRSCFNLWFCFLFSLQWTPNI